MANSQSTVTLQNLYDDLVSMGDLDPGWDMSGYTVRPIITIANTVFKQFCGGEGLFPWPWNQFNLPQFYFNSWQQDYALVTPTGASITNIGWLQEGMGIDINNPQVPKPQSYVEVGRSLGRSTAAYISNSAFMQPICVATKLFNSQMYFGTWGAAVAGNNTWGNNPQPNQVITNPLAAGRAMPNNPILQIQDANGNLLALTGFGTEGSTAPVAPANSVAGTIATPGSGATTQWTVVDPQGFGIRITPVPSQTGTVWQMNLIAQAKPVQFSASVSLASQTLYPLTDNYYTDFLQGCKAQAHGFSPNSKTRALKEKEEAAWLRVVQEMKKGDDREKEENRITVKRSILGAGGGPSGQNWGPFWPFGGRPS